MSECKERFYKTIMINGKKYEYVVMMSNTEIVQNEFRKMESRNSKKFLLFIFK